MNKIDEFPYWSIPYFAIDYLLTAGQKCALVSVEQNSLTINRTSENFSVSQDFNKIFFDNLHRIHSSLHTILNLTDTISIFAFSCTDKCIIFESNDFSSDFFYSLKTSIAKLHLPTIFANNDYVRSIKENESNKIIAFGSSKGLLYCTPIIINIQSIMDFYKHNAVLSKFDSNEISDNIAMILANLNPEIALFFKKNDMQFYYVFFHKEVHNNSFILHPFVIQLQYLLKLSSDGIKILETNSIHKIKLDIE